MRITALVLLVLMFASRTYASEEGILPLTRFHIESAGIGESGRIVVDGEQNDARQLVDLRITAFGKNHTVPKENLKELAEIPANGIRLSFETGYPEPGGRTVYIQFQMGFASSTQKQATVTVTESGKIEVRRVETAAPGASKEDPARVTRLIMACAANARSAGGGPLLIANATIVAQRSSVTSQLRWEVTIPEQNPHTDPTGAAFWVDDSTGQCEMIRRR